MTTALLVLAGVAVSVSLALQSRRTEIRCDELAKAVEHERHELRNLAVIARGAERRADRAANWILSHSSTTGRGAVR